MKLAKQVLESLNKLKINEEEDGFNPEKYYIVNWKSRDYMSGPYDTIEQAKAANDADDTVEGDICKGDDVGKK